MKRSASEIDTLLQELSRVHGHGGVNPGVDRLRRLIEADRDGPLHFLNLLAYHDEARYPEGHELAPRKLSGAEAYTLYGEVALRHVTRRGGQIAIFNEVEQDLIGPDEEWDQIAIMQYPSTEAFLDMIQDPDYLTGLVHRDAGLARTTVIVSRPLLPAAG